VRLAIYVFLTQWIVLLGALRDKVMPWAMPGVQWDARWKIRRDRTFMANSFESWECCDCGMTHLTRPLDGEEPRFPAFKMIPVRPVGYNYQGRYGATPSSPFVNEDRFNEQEKIP